MKCLGEEDYFSAEEFLSPPGGSSETSDRAMCGGSPQKSLGQRPEKGEIHSVSTISSHSTFDGFDTLLIYFDCESPDVTWDMLGNRPVPTCGNDGAAKAPHLSASRRSLEV